MDINELSGWGISQTIAQIVENGFTYDEETGEVFFTSDDLDTLQEALDSKFESLAGIYQMYLSKAEALKERGKEIVERSKSFDKKAEKLKNYIDTLMQLNGKDKLEVGDKKISYKKSVSSEIFDEEALRKFINSSEEYQKKYYKDVVPDIKKKELGDAIKATKVELKDENGKVIGSKYNLEIPGFRLVENKNLSIK